MPSFRYSQIRFAQNAATSSRAAARETLANRTPSAPFPVVSTCPEPTCDCTPMPEGLDIDRASKLNGTMAPYSSHVLVHTGQHDWKRKIEDEQSTGTWGPFLSHLKKAFGRGGHYHDPSKNVLVSASSWQASDGCEATMFPSSLWGRFAVNQEGSVNNDVLNKFCEHVGGATLDEDSNEHGHSPLLRPLKYPTIMICSHNSRDGRCGVLGPVLHDQFRKVLSKRYATELPVSEDSEQRNLSTHKVNIGMISHVGGHKWAGNVILQIPAQWPISISSENGTAEQASPSPLAGAGIWYGRVEPRHVEGIVEETLLNGKVVQDLFRGGIDRHGQVLRIP